MSQSFAERYRAEAESRPDVASGRCRRLDRVVWNIDLLNADLGGDLDCHADLIRGYMLTPHR